MPTGAHPRDPRIDKYSPIADESIRHDMVVGHRLSESICFCARATHASVQGGLRGVDRVEFVITGSVGKPKLLQPCRHYGEIRWHQLHVRDRHTEQSPLQFRDGPSHSCDARMAEDCSRLSTADEGGPRAQSSFRLPSLGTASLLHQLLLVFEPADLTLPRLSRIRVRLIRVAPDECVPSCHMCAP